METVALLSAVALALGLTVWRRQCWHRQLQRLREQHEAVLGATLAQHAPTGWRTLRRSETVRRPQSQSGGWHPDLTTEWLLGSSNRLDANGDAFLLVRLTGTYRRGAPETSPPFVLSLSELRARRALFNSPAAYQAAFGEPPDPRRVRALATQEEQRAPPR